LIIFRGLPYSKDQSAAYVVSKQCIRQGQLGGVCMLIFNSKSALSHLAVVCFGALGVAGSSNCALAQGGINGWQYEVTTYDDPYSTEEYDASSGTGFADGLANSNVITLSTGTILSTIHCESSAGGTALEDDSPNAGTAHYFRKRKHAFSCPSSFSTTSALTFEGHGSTSAYYQGLSYDAASFTASIGAHSQLIYNYAGCGANNSFDQEWDGNLTFAASAVNSDTVCTFYISAGTDAYVYMQTGPTEASGATSAEITVKLSSLSEWPY
jgi:hypothetical protein